MNSPKTVKQFLKHLILISNVEVYELKGLRTNDAEVLAHIKALIQNELGEDENGIVSINNLKW